MSASSLTDPEQANVRAAMRYLRVKCGSWYAMARACRLGDSTVSNAVRGEKQVSAEMAFRVARFARVGLDELLSGRFPPPGTCPFCGHRKEEEA